MRSSLKSVVMCSAVLALCGLAIGQQGTDAKKPPAPAGAPSNAQPKGEKPAAAPAPGGMDEMMQAMMKAGTPGPEHKKLEPMVGTFDVTAKFSMGPGQPEQTSKGTAVNTWVMDGRFVQMTYKGDMMGMPFQGMGFMGYNNTSKQYESFWIDSMMTAMSMSTGSTTDGKTFSWSGECDDPMTGQKKKSRSVNKITDTGYTFEMFEVGPDGKEISAGTLTFTRTGAAPKSGAGANAAPTKPGAK